MNADKLIGQIAEGVASDIEGDVWNALLADIHAYAMTAWTFHWRAGGPNYYADHELFGRLYKEAHECLDSIAETAIGTADDDMYINVNHWASKTAECVQKSVGGRDADSINFPDILFDMASAALHRIHFSLDALNNEGRKTDGTEDLLQGLANKFQSHVYLLQQRRRRG